MQLIFPTTLLAAASGPTALDAPVRDMVHQVGPGKLIVLFAALQVITVLGYWLVSELFCRPNATFGRAVLTWISLIGLGVAAALIAAVALPTVLSTAQNNRLAWLAIPAIGLLGLVAVLAIPMKIYGIDALRSFGFLLVHVALTGAAGAVLQFILLGSAMALHPHLIERIQAQLAPTPTPDPEIVRRRLNERMRVLNQRFEQLDIRHRHLPANDAAAAAAYERDKAAYDRDVQELKAEAAGLPR